MHPLPPASPAHLQDGVQETALQELVAATGQALEGPPGVQSGQHQLLSLQQVRPHRWSKGLYAGG